MGSDLWNRKTPTFTEPGVVRVNHIQLMEKKIAMTNMQLHCKDKVVYTLHIVSCKQMSLHVIVGRVRMLFPGSGKLFKSRRLGSKTCLIV